MGAKSSDPERIINPGLEMLSKGLNYVLALNKVPLQFSKDCIDNPKKRHRLLRNKVEHEQLSLFGDVEAEHDITWRILAEPFITEEEGDELEQSLPRWEVALVGFNSYGAQISMVTHQSNVTVPLIPVDSTSLPVRLKLMMLFFVAVKKKTIRM